MMVWKDEANLDAASSRMLADENQVGPAIVTPAVLGAAAGAAAVTAGREAFTALGNGLSFAAELTKSAGQGGTGPDVATTNKGGLPLELSQRIRDLTERIRRQLATAGMKLSKPLELVGDGLGGIAVGGGHPQQSAIERVIGSDVLLERDFARLASDYRDVAIRDAGGRPDFVITIPAAS